jgi:hypothetical protein
MLLQRLDNNLTLTLPDDLIWTDEHHWTAAICKTDYMLTGSLLVETGIRQKGRPITLQAESDMAWVTRGVVDQLYEWANVVALGAPLRLRLTFFDNTPRARSFTVVFRLNDGAIEAQPVLGLPHRSSADWYRTTLRFLEI